MYLTMFVSGLLLSIAIILEFNETNCESTSEYILKNLQLDLEQTMLTAENIRKGNLNLTEEIKIALSFCNETLSKLKEKKHSMFVKAVEQNITIGEIMLKIEQEDLAHEKLEYELKKVYAELNLFGVAYGIAYENLLSLQSKRQMGSDLRCESILKQLKNSETTSQEDVIGARSMNKEKINHLKGIVLKNKLNVARIQESELKSDQEALQMEKENDQQFCSLKERDLTEQIAFTKNVLKYSEDTVNLLKADFQTSITLTESLGIEIQFGRKLLETMKQNTIEFNKIKEFFKADETCYDSVQKLEL